MSWIERIVEERIAAAIERGELDPGPLKGQPLPDIDRPRREGWWAEEFVRRERSRIVHETATEERPAWERRFRAAPDEAALAALLTEADEWVAATNRRMLATDAIDPFDARAVTAAWRAARPRR